MSGAEPTPRGGGPAAAEISSLFERHRATLREASKLGPVVDLACGRGRHALALAAMGIPCLALDRSPDFLAELGAAAGDRAPLIHRARADLEAGHGIPVKAGTCGAILVFRFLFRPLAPAIEEALAPGGWLLYETFSVDQLELEGGPRRRSFLLEHGELPTLFPGLEVISYEETTELAPTPRAVARLAARRPLSPG